MVAWRGGPAGPARQTLASMRRGSFLILSMAVLSFSRTAAAGPVEVGVETVQDNTSLVTLKTDMDAAQESVWELLTDYDHHARFLPYITRSRVTAREDERQVVEQEGRIQILFWSYTMRVTQRVWEDSPRHMHFTAIEGDFDVLQGDFYLSVPTVLELKTRLVCEFIVKPKRRVPDWAVRMAAKHYLKKMVAVIAEKAERSRR